jgi:hypothetical protein
MNSILSVAIISIAIMTLNSCEKSTTEPTARTSDNATPSNVYSQKYFEALPHALAAYVKEQTENGTLKSGAEFIPAIVSWDYFGFFIDIEFYIDEYY